MAKISNSAKHAHPSSMPLTSAFDAAVSAMPSHVAIHTAVANCLCMKKPFPPHW